MHSWRGLFVARFLDSLCRSVRHGSLERRELCPLDNRSGKSAVFRYSSISLGYLQLLSGVAQPVYQVLGPKYSETWFSLKGRTTATMFLAVGMYSHSERLEICLSVSSSEPDRKRHRSTYPPIHFYAKAIGMWICPLYIVPMSNTLCLGTYLGHNDFNFLSSRYSRPVQTSNSTKYVFVPLQRNDLSTHVEIAYSGSQPSPPMHETLLAWVGKGVKGQSNLSSTERLDFTILVVLFGVLVAAVSSFSIFTNQIFVSLPTYSEASAVTHIANEKGACRILV